MASCIGVAIAVGFLRAIFHLPFSIALSKRVAHGKWKMENDQFFMERLRSQILGIIVVAIILLVLACIRYYFKLG